MNILSHIGNTPLVNINKYCTNNNISQNNISLKLEYFNPSHSVKDRTVLTTIEKAESQNLIQPGVTTIVEATSGNTGVSLAMICAIKGYQCIIVMTAGCSLEKKMLIRNYGANIILTSEHAGMRGSIIKANQLCNSNPNYYFFNQFEKLCDTDKIASEIYQQTNGNVDIIVAGVGTGTTLNGIYKHFKTIHQNMQIVAVEPLESPVLSGGNPGSHNIQGIGVGFIPPLVNINDYDDIIQVSSKDAKTTVNDLILTEGINVGYSSGAVVCACKTLAKRPENLNKKIVGIIASSGERYLYTELYDKNFIEVNCMPICDISEI
jgi:cysteine synthase A